MKCNIQLLKGDCFDNACHETFFSTVKNELVHHVTFHTSKEAQTAIVEYIEIPTTASGCIRPWTT